MEHLQKTIENAWTDRGQLQSAAVKAAIEGVIADLDAGRQRVASPNATDWQVNEWVKKAIILYFSIRDMAVTEAGPLQFHDKIPLKRNYAEVGVRVAPPAAVRYGVFLAKGVIVMPSYINIGAYVGAETMIDIGVVVGSGAQIGQRVHVSGGATIGGVLEPIQASPVIIEDDVFIGANSAIVAGVHVKKGAVIAANITITDSSRIIDVSQPGTVTTHRGVVPEQSVVIPGTFPKEFPGGTYQVPCGLIIGKRNEKTDAKVALNQALR